MATERYDAIINIDYLGSAGVAKLISDVQRARQALGALQSATNLAGTAPALALGTGAGVNRDVADSQRQFVAALRDRAAAEREAAAAARRAAAIDRRLDRPGLSDVQFSQSGGIIGGRFDENLKQLESGTQRLERELAQLTREYQQATAALKPLTAQQVNAHAAQHNLDVLRGRQLADADLNLGGYSARAAAAGARYFSVTDLVTALDSTNPNEKEWIRKLLYQGEANSTALKQMTAEVRQAILGSPEGPKALGLTTQYGAPVPGLINQDQARRYLESERLGGLDERVASTQAQLAAARADEARVITLSSQTAAEVQVAEQRAALELQRQAARVAIANAVTTAYTRETAKATETVRLYHSSPQSNLPAILAQGLRPDAKIEGERYVYLSDKPGAFGRGDVYPVDVERRKLSQGAGSDFDYLSKSGYYRHEGPVPPSQIHWDDMQKMAAEREAVEQQAIQAERKLTVSEEELAAASQRLAASRAAAAGGDGGRIGGPPPTSQGGFDEPPENPRERLRREFEERIAAQGASGYDEVNRARAKLAKAEVNLAAVLDKATITYGEKGGFADKDAAFSAYAGAKASKDAADQALTRVLRARVKAEEDAARAAEGSAQQQFTAADRLTANAEIYNRGGISAEQRARLDTQVTADQLAAARKNLAAASAESSNRNAYASALGQVIAAEKQHADAVRALSQAERQAASAAGGGGGGFGPHGPGSTPPGGFFGDFAFGFRGRQDRSYGEQLGQTFKFSVFYGTAYKILFGLTQTLSATLQEGIAFQQAMTDLTIATNRPKEELEGLATELGRSAVVAGAAPSQGIQVGARSLGLYGVADGSAAEQDRVARISAQVVSRLAVGSQKQPVDLQGDIAAIAQALGLGAEGQYRIADLDAFFTKKFGIQQGQTLQAVAQSATVGKAAGFSDEQLFAIGADLISRTGQTDSAVAGFMAQIFSRGGEGSLTDVSRKFGIDPSQELAKVLEQLAGLYQNAAPQQQNEIAAAFGRGKVQNAAIALLSDFEEVQKQVGASRTDAVGAADRQFAEHMRNIGGRIALLSGQFKDFAQLLGESGILDAVGGLVVLFTELLEVTNGFLRVWNLLPDVAQDGIIALGIFIAAIRSSAGAAGLAYAGGGLAGGARIGAQAGLAAAGKALVSPVGIAIGGLLAIGALKNSADRLREAEDSAADALLTRVQYGAGPSAFEAQAAALDSAADKQRSATGTFAQIVSFGTANNAAERSAKQLESSAKYLRDYAQGLSDVGPTDTSAFHDFSASGLESSLSELTNRGVSAREQMDLLRQAIHGLGTDSEGAANRLTKFDPKEFAAGNSSDLTSALGEALGTFRLDRGNGDIVDPKFNVGRLLSDMGLNEETIGKRFEAALNSLGITSASQLTPEAMDEITKIVTAGFGDKTFGKKEYDSQVQAALDQAFKDRLADIVKGQFGGTLGLRELNPQETLATVRNALELSKTSLANTPEHAFGDRVKIARQQLRAALTALRSGSIDEDTEGSVSEAIQELRNQLARAQIARLEALRRVAVQSAKNDREARRIGRASLIQQVRALVSAGGDVDVLADVLGTSSRAAIALARQTIQHAIELAKAALEAERFMGTSPLGPDFEFGAGLPDVLKTDEPTSPEEVAIQKRIQGLNKLLAALGSLTSAEPGQGIDDIGLGDKADGPTAAQIAAARASAYAVQDGGQIAAARAAIQTARADLAAAKKGTVEYYNALGSLFSAQQELADALLAYQHNLGLLRIDATNPLQVARLEARLAARKLAQDRAAGRGPDVIAQDKVDLRAAQANEEATRFSQRLQAVQTAEELGRISHKKYIAYLENEKHRLETIKNRTFQQQDQLNQIDSLLQDAAKQMEAQFNFGDIKLPTPYQVRRYIEAQTGSAAARQVASNNAGSTSVQNVEIRVNGADTAKVTQIVKDVVGRGARVTTTSTRRR